MLNRLPAAPVKPAVRQPGDTIGVVAEIEGDARRFVIVDAAVG